MEVLKLIFQLENIYYVKMSEYLLKEYLKIYNNIEIQSYLKIGFITSGPGLTEEGIHMNYKNK